MYFLETMKSETNQSNGVLKRLKYRKTPENLYVNLYFIYTK